MDTHIAAHPEFEPDTVRVTARLPGEMHNERTDASDVGETRRVSDSAAPNEAQLEGVPEPSAGDRLATSKPPPRRRRARLFAGVAITGVAVAGVGTFLVSPYNHLFPVPRLTSEVHQAMSGIENKLRPILAPSASLAGVSLPKSAAPTRDHHTTEPQQTQVTELMQLHAATSSTTAATAPAHADGRPTTPVSPHQVDDNSTQRNSEAAATDIPSDYVPSEPGALPAAQAADRTPNPLVPPRTPSAAADITTAVVASMPRSAQVPPAQPAPVTVQAPAITVPATPPSVEVASGKPSGPVITSPATPVPNPGQATPSSVAITPAAPDASRDPIDVAIMLRAAPMSAPEQIQVMGMVSEMAAMVKDLRRQDAQLRSDFAKASAATASHLADYERRLALAETRAALAAAAGDPTGDAPAIRNPDAPTGLQLASSAVQPVSRVVPTNNARPTAAPPAAVVAVATKIFRVQAASPGLALLAQVDRGGGEGAQLQVVVGDSIPDYGRVKAIAQKGTTWVVSTEHGDIQ